MSARKQSKRARFSAEIKHQRRINRSLFAIRQQLKNRRGRGRVMEQFRQALDRGCIRFPDTRELCTDLDRYGFRHQRRQFEAPERTHSQVQPLRIWIDECAAIDPRVWANL